jgi:uncharacterized membrane protein
VRIASDKLVVALRTGLILSYRNYVAVAADTFSSELGILAKIPPRLVIAPWRTVPKGTNGGVTLTGLLAGMLGSSIISVVTVLLLPFCSSSTKIFAGSATITGWNLTDKALFTIAMTMLGVTGSLLDSVLGALLQASVVDRKSGKVVEGEGGRKVALPVVSAAEEKASSDWQIAIGRDILSNNGVNLVMAASMSLVSMLAACFAFGIDPKAVWD